MSVEIDNDLLAEKGLGWHKRPDFPFGFLINTEEARRIAYYVTVRTPGRSMTRYCAPNFGVNLNACLQVINRFVKTKDRYVSITIRHKKVRVYLHRPHPYPHKDVVMADAVLTRAIAKAFTKHYRRGRAISCQFQENTPCP